MSSKHKAPETESTDAAAPAATDASADGELQEIRQENAALKERLLRTIADMENLRKRTERERSDTARYAISNFARDVLAVEDNLDRALQAVESDKGSPEDKLKNLIEGMQMTRRDLLNTLERHGIKRLLPEGERFDPNLHQAMFEVEDASVPHGQVVNVVQAGFSIGERVLRPAMVGVSKGGPREAPAARDDAGQTATESTKEAGSMGGKVDRQA